MQSNPIVEQQKKEEAERRAKAAFRYPFRIICVYMDEDSNDFPIIREVRDYCNKNHLIFINRQYDIDKYSDDMFIKRLPAFHIYYKRYYDDTVYYDMDPVHQVQVKVWAFQDEERAKERARQRRQERWDQAVTGVKSIFSLERFKKKPALDLDASLSHERDGESKAEPESSNRTENKGKSQSQ